MCAFFVVQSACVVVEGDLPGSSSGLVLALGSNSSVLLSAALAPAGGGVSGWWEPRGELSGPREGPAAVVLDGMATFFGGRGTTEVEQLQPGGSGLVTLERRTTGRPRRFPAAVAVPKSFCRRNWG